MNPLQDLYQQLIVDHNRHPRNFGKLEGATQTLEGHNPLCGDQLTLYLKLEDGQIIDIRFDGKGCAISVASASLMTDAIKGKCVQEAEDLFRQFRDLVGGKAAVSVTPPGKLQALAGVRAYPSRVKCATLCWHTLQAALSGGQDAITTE